MKKLVVSMFLLVTASFFFVCGASATSFDGYYQYGTVTSIVTDKVVYNDLSIPAGTESYFDVSFTFGQVTYYNSTMQQISVGSVTYSTSVGFLSISSSDPSVVISYDEDNRVHCLFQNDFSGDLQFSIKYYIRNTLTGGSPSNATLQNITMRRTVTTHYGNMNHSFNGSPSFGVIDDKLNQILESLGASSGSSKFLGDDALFYLNESYFQGVNGSSGVRNFNSDGVCEFTSPASSTPYRVHYFGGDGTSSGSQSVVGLQSGDYVFYYSAPVEVSNIIIYDWQDNYSIKDHVDVIRDISHVGYFVIHVSSPISSWQFSLEFNDSFTGVIYGGLARMDINQSAQDAINPDQSGLVDDVDNAGQQQQQQEKQLWTNINSYKGDLTFNLDDWSEAAGGLSYVSGIFMSIWNNSPTQIIVLSLMLGIAMLSIGRGAMAAVRVSRNRRNDD